MSLMLGLQPYSFVCANTNNATVVKTIAGQLGNSIHIANVAAAARFLKFYDKASTPAPASDVPVLVVAVPAAAVGGITVVNLPNGLAFKAGISFVLVTGLATTDNTSPSAADCICNFSYM